MSKYDNGVSAYVHAKAVVHVHFPVDFRGNSDVCCQQCYFYRESSRRCGLTGQISEYPAKYIGSMCPLEFENPGEDARKNEEE